MIPNNTLAPLDDPNSVEAYIQLRSKVAHTFEPGSEVSEFIIDLDFDILGVWSTDDTYEYRHEIVLGQAQLRLIRVSSALNEEIPLAELFDESQSLTNLQSALFEVDHEYTPAILKRFSTANSFCDLFSIESIVLKPWARRQRIGLAVIRRLIQNWSSGCSLAALQPLPAQIYHEEIEIADWDQYHFDKLPEDLANSQKRLTSYFHQLGFETFKDCPYLLLSLELMPPLTDDLDLPQSVHIPPAIAKNVEQEQRPC